MADSTTTSRFSNPGPEYELGPASAAAGLIDCTATGMIPVSAVAGGDAAHGFLGPAGGEQSHSLPFPLVSVPVLPIGRLNLRV